MCTSALRSSYLGFILRLILSTFLVFILAAPALADSHVRIVRLSYIDGDVELDKGDSHGFNPAYMNMPVLHQSKLWARDGQAEVEFEDGSSIRLTPDTIIAFTDLTLGDDGHRSTTVALAQGTAYFDIHHHDGDKFQLQFGREQLELTKSAHFRVDNDKREFEVAVFSGEAQVASGASSEVAVKKGETIRLDSDNSDSYDLAKGIDVENYDSWDRERASGHDQTVTTASTWGGNSDLTYGYSDLNAYGNYFFVPGYGYMWRPTNAGLGWDPFADGYWVQYPGFGYTFISGYPWGWAPYRYGSWQFVNGYGWCWAPGSNWNYWNTVPPVRNPPQHFRPIVPPHNGSGVVVVSNGVTRPLPEHRVIVDNDALDHQRPHSTKITTASGEVVRRGQTGAPVAAQGFIAPAINTSTVPVVAPGVASVPTQPRAPMVGVPHHGDDGRIGNRDAQLNQTKQAGPTATAGATRPVAPMSAAPAHNMIEPASHISAPVMRSSGMSSGMSAPRMSSPSMSSGGAHMSMGSAGGGHSGGGSGHR